MNSNVTLADIFPFLTERGQVEVELAAQKCLNRRLSEALDNQAASEDAEVAP